MRALWVVVGGAVLAALAVWFYSQGHAPNELCDSLARANVIRVLTDPEGAPSCEGVRAREGSFGHVRKLLEQDGAGLVKTLEAAGAGALVLPTSALDYGQHPPGGGRTRALFLGPSWEVIAPLARTPLRDAERRVLAQVARGLLRSAREPRVSAFPPSLRRVQQVEVMVLLRRGAVHRLWRSARGRSIAQALLTASRVARERWAERQAAMGGPLNEALSELTVEVLWLREDGTLGDAGRQFVDSRVPEGWGVGLDYRNGWHYVLPRAVERHGGSATEALLALLEDQGVPRRALSERGARLYRFVPVTLGVSPPSDAVGSGSSAAAEAEDAGSAAGNRTVNVVP